MNTNESVDVQHNGQVEDLSIEQLEDVSGGKFFSDTAAKVTALAIWEGIKWVANRVR